MAINYRPCDTNLYNLKLSSELNVQKIDPMRNLLFFIFLFFFPFIWRFLLTLFYFPLALSRVGWIQIKNIFIKKKLRWKNNNIIMGAFQRKKVCRFVGILGELELWKLRGWVDWYGNKTDQHHFTEISFKNDKNFHKSFTEINDNLGEMVLNHSKKYILQLKNNSFYTSKVENC